MSVLTFSPVDCIVPYVHGANAGIFPMSSLTPTTMAADAAAVSANAAETVASITPSRFMFFSSVVLTLFSGPRLRGSAQFCLQQAAPGRGTAGCPYGW